MIPNNQRPMMSGAAMLLLFASLGFGQVFDAPAVVRSNNSNVILDIFNFSGPQSADAICIRVDIFAPSSFVVLSVQGVLAGPYFPILSGWQPSLGAMIPVSAVGQIGLPGGPEEAVVGLGSQIWLIANNGGAITGPTMTTTAPGGEILDVALGHFQGLGSPREVASLTTSSLNLHPFSGNAFGTPISLPVVANANSRLLAGRFLSAGKDGFAVVGSTVEIYEHTGNGLVHINSIAHGVSNPMPTAGDIDGDGDDDIVIFGDTDYVVLRCTGQNQFSIEAPVTGGPATQLYDIDDDGDLDGVCCSSGGGGPPAIFRAPSTFHISVNDSGVFRPAYKLPGMGSYRLAGVADVNGDGKKDLVAGRAAYLSRTTLAENPWAPGLVDPELQSQVRDLDGDGDPDLGHSFDENYVNHGSLTLDPASLALMSPPPPGTFYASPCIASDFDGDGQQDLIAELRNAAGPLGMRILYGRGGSFLDQGYALPAGVAFSPYIGTSPERVLVVDVDADGDLDIITKSPGPFYWSHLWRNDGVGIFSLGAIFDTEVVVDALDFNSDGFMDFLVSSGNLRIRIGLPGGTWAPSQSLTTATYPYFNAANSFDPFRDTVGISDFNLDGDLDILAAERTNSGGSFPTLLQNQGSLPFLPGSSPGGIGGNSGLTDTRIVVGDIDLDGYPDAVISNPFNASEKGAGIIFGSNSINHFDAARTQQLFLEVHALADMDGDGDLDAVGPAIVQNVTIDGPNKGSRSQWGLGLPGSGGITPLLGSSAPVRVGSPLDLRLVGAVGGGAGFLAVGTAPANWSFFGGTLYTVPAGYVTITCSGTAGVAGLGMATLPVGVLPPSFAGLTVHLQAVIADAAAPAGVSLSNALPLSVGP